MGPKRIRKLRHGDKSYSFSSIVYMKRTEKLELILAHGGDSLGVALAHSICRHTCATCPALYMERTN
jgi:hypothetical protein